MTTAIGNIGEQLVSQWLESLSYCILDRSWHCRWGEIDVIACDKNSSTLIFVEVKTRSSSNWDNDGLDAISLLKQQKISRSAELFLAQNTQYTDCYMRFDVALVKYRYCDRQLANRYKRSPKVSNESLLLNSATAMQNGFQFTIIDYIENAFDTICS